MALEDASKQHLHKAIHNDTLFLARSEVVDYSLLVGIDTEKKQLVLGIIDYLRLYTLDKMAEETVKSVGMVLGKAAPTIQNPRAYKQRFREAMDGYFMVMASLHSLESKISMAYSNFIGFPGFSISSNHAFVFVADVSPLF